MPPIKFFFNKIRIANVQPPSPSAALPAPSPLPTTQIFNQNNVKSDNIFHDLEGPDLHSFGITDPASKTGVGEGIRGANMHLDAQGKEIGVAKGDANSFLTEPLVYHIGEHIQKGMFPRTVIRNYVNNVTRKVTPHSLQEFAPGKQLTSDWDKAKVKNHPHHAAIKTMDWLLGNNDRHDANMIYDKNQTDPMKQLRAIDNGGAFDYKSAKDGPLDTLQDVTGSFSDEFRHGILNADEEHLGNLFDRIGQHPAHRTADDWGKNDARNPENGFLAGNFNRTEPWEAKDGFMKRLRMVKEAMAADGDDRIDNPQQLRDFLRGHIDYDTVDPAKSGGYTQYAEDDNAPHKYTENFDPAKNYDNTYGNTHNNYYNNTNDRPRTDYPAWLRRT